MNRIDELIAELCPEGVGLRDVGNVVEVVPTAKGVKRQDYASGSLFPIVDQGQSLVAGYTDDESILLKKSEYIVFGTTHGL